MAAIARLWFVRAESADAAGVLPRAVELAGAVAGPGSEAAVRALGAARGVAVHLDPQLEDPERALVALGGWARRFAGRQCAVVGAAWLVERAVGEALGVGEGAAFALRDGGCAAIDWPLEEGAPAALVGFDLDWCPTFLPEGRPKFPGGPGVAPSGRA